MLLSSLPRPLRIGTMSSNDQTDVRIGMFMSVLQWKVAPILAAGNTCVCKPSELASVTCLELCDIMDAAGLPAGVLNLITGLGTEAGAPLRHCLFLQMFSRFCSADFTALELLIKSAELLIQNLFVIRLLSSA